MNKSESIRLYETGKKLYSSKKYKEAISVFSSIDTSFVGNFEESIIHHYIARCYSRLYHLNFSIKRFRKALKYRPNYTKIHLDMGLTYYFFYENSKISRFVRKLGFYTKLDKAQKCFEEGLLVNESDWMLWYYRGYMQELNNETKDANESYKKAISVGNKIENMEKSKLFDKICTHLEVVK